MKEIRSEGNKLENNVVFILSHSIKNGINLGKLFSCLNVNNGNLSFRIEGS